MNKYQKKILEDVKISLLSKKGNGEVNITDKAITLIQNENYNICNYVLVLESIAIDSVKTDKKVYQSKKSVFELDIDFNDQVSFIEFIAKNNIVEPFKLKVEYKNADKETYDEKITREKRDELLEKLDLKLSYGNNLVNIYWNLINEKVNLTKIILFLNCDNKMRYLTEKTFENTLRYFSINDLAYGNYAIKLFQYIDNKELIETDYLKFTLSENIVKIKTDQEIKVHCNGGKHTVAW